MQVGVMTVLYHDLELTEALDRIAALGVRTVELATGNYVGNAHADPAELLADDGRTRSASSTPSTSARSTISALSQHGNPLHPRREIADAHDRDLPQCGPARPAARGSRRSSLSAAAPAAPGRKRPNWVTCPWPPDFSSPRWQWNDASPFWSRERSSRGPRRADRHRDASRHSPSTTRKRSPPARIGGETSASTSTRPTSSGRASTRRAPGARRRRRIFHVHAKDTASTHRTSPSTACSTPRATPTRATARGLPHRRLRPRPEFGAP